MLQLGHLVTKTDLARQLRDDVTRAAPGYKVVAIHLFGITHEPALRGISLPELVDEAGVPRSYAVEIHKGMRLAEFVRLK